METCKTCRYWLSSEVCRRFPKHELRGQDGWCGEYREPPKPEPQQPKAKKR
jgi:hypothetical protein